METEERKPERLALVTGANRGIGLEVCRQLASQGMTVLLGARDVTKGEVAAHELRTAGLDVRFHLLDVSRDDSVHALYAAVESEFGWLDVLVNNAGILYDMWQTATTADLAIVHEALETNLFGAWRTSQIFLPLLRKGTHSRIVHVSSEAGSFNEQQGLGSVGYGSSGGGLPAYGVSKAALNALTVKLAAELKDTGILVNAVCPGYTATYPEAVGGRPVEEGAASVVWAATLPDEGPNGGFFRDGKPLQW